MANVYEVTFDRRSGVWTNSRFYNIMVLHSNVTYANHRLQSRCKVDEFGNTIMRGYITLNELLENLELPLVPEGLDVGWLYDKNDVEAWDFVELEFNPKGSNPNIKVRFKNIVKLAGELVP